MIVVLKENPNERQLAALKKFLTKRGVSIHVSQGVHQTILGLVGDTSAIDMELIESLDIVETVKRVQEPYKNANRKFHPQNTIINVSNVSIGGSEPVVIAGPCSVETPEQIITVARAVKAAGAKILRGGAFKPRTSPYAFQGLGSQGIKLLVQAKQDTGLPIITEIMDISTLEFFDDVDIIQVGARNMQNFELLKQLGHCKKPILLKRGLANTYQELLMSAEYIMASGNEDVILCERGIRTFESYTRNTLDISAIPVLKSLSHLPVIIDPSHAIGISKFVSPLAFASVVAGADGLMIEVHNEPMKALCDGAQSLTPEQFSQLMVKIKRLSEIR